MNEKQINKIIAELKALTKGTMSIVRICETKEDKELMLQCLKGKRGVKTIEVLTRDEQDEINRKLKKKIENETMRRLAKLKYPE